MGVDSDLTLALDSTADPKVSRNSPKLQELEDEIAAIEAQMAESGFYEGDWEPLVEHYTHLLEEKDSEHTYLRDEGEKTHTRSYLIGYFLSASLLLLLLMLNAMPTEEPKYGADWEGGNGWEFIGYRGTTAEIVWLKTIEIEPNEDGSYTYDFSNAPGYDLDYCNNDRTMNSTYMLTCGGNTGRTGFPEGIWVTDEDYDRIKIGQYTEANTTLWFKPLNDTGVTYEIQVEVVQIESSSTFVGIANTIGIIILLGMMGVAFKTNRKTGNSAQKSASEGVLAVGKVGLFVGLILLLLMFLFSLFVGYVAYSVV